MSVLILLIALDWNNQLRCDLHYTANKAFGVDIQLMLMTYILFSWSKNKVQMSGWNDKAIPPPID